MMIATLLEPDLEQLKAAMDELDPIADAFEIRFDACKSTVKPEQVRPLTSKVLVGTVRRPADGGSFSGSEHDRLATLEDCLAQGFEYVDVEGAVTVPGPEDRMIRSRHEFRATPSLASIIRMGEEITRNGALFKFATKTQSFADVLALLTACRTFQRSSLPFALMGLGEFPRPLTALMGATFVYGGGRTNAPGQPPLKDLHATMEHWGNPKPASSLYLVVGDPVEHSLSPRMHNAAFARDNADAAYGALRLSGVELQMLLERAEPLGLGGASVTTPLKDAAFELVKTRTPQAEKARAVNTIRIRGDEVVGHNTDGLGAKAIVSRLADPGAHVLIAGTGGAARAIAAALDGYHVTVAGRSHDRLRALAHELKVGSDTLAGAAVSLDDFDVVVNATRVNEPLPVNGYRGALFDLRYGPFMTPWERHARNAGLAFAGGRELLLEQGVLAYEFWTDRPAPRDAMKAALEVAA